MVTVKTICRLTIHTLAGTLAVGGIGLIEFADAQQRGTRPFIPRPGDVRPISRAQPPTLPSPPPSGGKGANGIASAPTAKQSDSTDQMVHFTGDDWTHDVKNDLTTAVNFTYTEGDRKVTGAKGKYNDNSKILDADGNLIMDDPKHHITGDKAHVDNSKKAKLAIFTGNVIIVIKPKENSADGGSKVAGEKGKGGTITCDRVEDYYKREFVILSGNLVFKQKITKKNGHVVERTLTAEHAEYDGKAEKLHLFAPVEMKDTDNQEGHFPTDVFIGTKEGEETLNSKTGSITFNKPEEEDESDNAKGAKPDDKSGTAGKEVPGAKDTTGKQDTPGTVPDKKQDPPATPPDKKQDPPVKTT